MTAANIDGKGQQFRRSGAVDGICHLLGPLIWSYAAVRP